MNEKTKQNLIKDPLRGEHWLPKGFKLSSENKCMDESFFQRRHVIKLIG